MLSGTDLPSGTEPLGPGARVLVAGAGITGRAVLAALRSFDADVQVCDDDAAALQAIAGAIAGQGAHTIDTAGAIAAVGEVDLVITSPGFPPSAPVLTAAAAAGVPVWGDVELAWRLDAAGHYGTPRQWLVVTGTNGKTTTT